MVESDANVSKESRNAVGGAVDGLDYWEMIELKRVFEAHGGSGSGTPKATAATASALTTPPTMITREQALLGLKAMELRGRRPRIFNLERPASTDKDSFNQLSGRSDGGGGDGGGGGGGGQDSINSKASESVKGKDANATSSAGATNFDVLFDAAVAESPATKGLVAAVSKKSINGGRGDGHTRSDDSKRVVADIAVLVRTLEEGVSGAGGVGPLHWGWLSCAEAGERSKRLYREASHAQRHLLLMLENGDDDITLRREEARTHDNIATLTRNAVRLETLATAAASTTQYTDLDADANKAAENGRTTLLMKGGRKCLLPNKGLLPPETPLGRVDFFVATEFHGHPFESPEEHDHTDSTTNVCDASLRSTESLTERLPGVTSPRHVEDDGSTITKGIGNASEQRGERPRFSRTIMTAGG